MQPHVKRFPEFRGNFRPSFLVENMYGFDHFADEVEEATRDALWDSFGTVDQGAVSRPAALRRGRGHKNSFIGASDPERTDERGQGASGLRRDKVFRSSFGTHQASNREICSW